MESSRGISGWSILTAVLAVGLAAWICTGAASMVWTATIPSGSPTTSITYVDRSAPRAGSVISYIDVGGTRYRCLGSYGKEGVEVLYDPQTPNRCREPAYLWSLMPRERMQMLLWFVAIGALGVLTARLRR